MSSPKDNLIEGLPKAEPTPAFDADHQAHSTIVRAGIWLIATILLLGFWWKPALAVAIGMIGASSSDVDGIDLLLNIAENFDSVLLLAVGLDLGMTLVSWGFAVFTVKAFEPN